MWEEISEVTLEQIARENRVSTGELAALKLALQKRKSKDIAESLDISESAARKRLGEVYRKFDIKGRGPGKLASLEQKIIERANDPALRYSTLKSTAPMFDPSFAAVASSAATDAAAGDVKTLYHWGDAPKLDGFQGRCDSIRSLSSWILEPAQSPKLLAICGIGGIGKTALSLKLAESVGHNFQQVVWLTIDPEQSPEDFTRSLLIALQSNASSKISLRRSYSNSAASIQPHSREDREETVFEQTHQSPAHPLPVKAPIKENNLPGESVTRLIRQLILHLSQQLCLVVLDGFEAVFIAEQESGLSVSNAGLLSEDKESQSSASDFYAQRAPTFDVSRRQQASAYKEGFGGYGKLLEAIKDSARHQDSRTLTPLTGSESHRSGGSGSESGSESGSSLRSSCLILTSREKPRELLSATTNSAIKLYSLSGLSDVDAKAAIKKFRLRGMEADYRKFVKRYSGHPMALLLAAHTIEDVFSGSISSFLDQDISVFDDLRSVLKEQFKRLPLAEKEAMYWLAINQKSCFLGELKADIVSRDHKANLLYTLRSLEQRSLIEVIQLRDAGPVHYCLHPIVLEYVLDRFVREIFQDLVRGKLVVFNSYALLKADAEDNLRELQTERIVRPILERLRNHFKNLEAVEHHLSDRLQSFRTSYPYRLGYAGGNFVNLLVQLLDGDLSNQDFSQLAIWQAYLPGVRLKESKFNACQLDRSVFTEALGDVLAIAFNTENNRYKEDDFRRSAFVRNNVEKEKSALLAAGDANGVVHLWPIESEQFAMDKQMASGYQSGQKLDQWIAHRGWVRSLSFVPNTHLLVTGGDDNKVKLWRLPAHHPKGAIPAKLLWQKDAYDWIYAIAVSPDGKMIACGDGDKIALYRTSDGNPIHAILNNPVRTLAFSPDGRWLASCGETGTICLWSTSDIEAARANMRPVMVLSGHRDLIQAVCFSADGTKLASGGNDKQIIVWKIESVGDSALGAQLHQFESPSDRIGTLAISPDGRFLVSGGDDVGLRVWDLETFEPIADISTGRSRLWSVAFSQQGSRLLLGAGGDGQRLMLWQVEQAELDEGAGEEQVSEGDLATALPQFRPWRTYRGYTRGIRALAYLGDRRLIGGGDSGDLLVWDVASGDRIAALALHHGRIWSVAVDAQRKRIASASDDYTVRLWSAQTGQCLTMLSGHSSWVRAVSFSDRGRYLASAGDDCTIRIWNTVSGICSTVLDRSQHWIRAVSFDPINGRYVVSGGDAQVVRRWDRKENRFELLAHHEHRICSVAHSSDGKWVASGSDDKTAIVWDLKKKEILHHFKQPNLGIKSVCFSPNNRYLAAGGEDQIVYVWDLESSNPNERCLKLRPNDYTGLAGGIRSVVFSPDSRFVVSGGLDEMVRQGDVSQMETMSEYDLSEGVLEPLIERDRPYENLEIENVTGLSSLQVANLLSLGAINSKKSLLL